MTALNKLRYSPVNGLIVNWSNGNTMFNDCGLPHPVEEFCKKHPHDICCADGFAPIEEVVDTYGWARWLPEVIVGVNDPHEEVAANYVREAAIQFAKQSMVLQRRLYIHLQPDVKTYPLTPAIGENIIGVLALIDQNRRCWCANNDFIDFRNGRFSFDKARSEITVELGSNPCWSHRPCGIIELIVWSAPSEDACEHDVYLYDFHRREITLEARMRYVSAYHFRDKVLLATMQPTAQFKKDYISARMDATRWLSRGAVKHPQQVF